MEDLKEQRQGVGRRRHPRGGRRSTDVSGYSPMILFVDEDSYKRDVAEAILSKLRFAVAPVESVDRAVAVTRAMRPAVVLANEKDVNDLRRRIFQSTPIPIVALTHELRTADGLVDAIRIALRAPTY
jgi:CheY-like chemotaxis protein